jgi:hypothetical protein
MFVVAKNILALNFQKGEEEVNAYLGNFILDC